MPRTAIGFNPYFHKAFTGEPRIFFNLISELDRERFDPVIVTNKHSPLFDALNEIGCEPTILDLPPAIGNEAGLALGGGPIRKFKAWLSVRRFNRDIGEIFGRSNVRIIIGRSVKGMLLNYLAAKRLGARLIWDIGMESDSKGIVWLLHVFCFLKADFVVTEGSFVAKSVFTPWQLKRFGHKIVVNPPGITRERVEQLKRDYTTPQKPGEPFVILKVASINQRKNQMMLMRALRDLAPKHPDVQIWLAGPTTDEDYEADVRGFLDEHGLTDRVRFLGWQDDIAGLLHQTNLFALSSNIEGVPQSMIEAVHAHVPLLSTAAGGVPDVIKDGETGRLVPIGDQDAFTQALDDCLTHRDRLPVYAAKAKDHIHATFMSELWYKRYEALFDKLCPPGSAGS